MNTEHKRYEIKDRQETKSFPGWAKGVSLISYLLYLRGVRVLL